MNFFILDIDGHTPSYIEGIKKAGVEGKIKLGQIHVYGEKAEERKDEVSLHKEKGLSFLARYLSQTSEVDLKKDDHLVPSHEAPHVLAQVIIVLLESRGYKWELKSFPEGMGTPYEVDLEKGIRAISLTQERCPGDCQELCACKSKEEEGKWNLQADLEDYARRYSFEFVGFRCSHFVDSISTIPMRDIIQGWLGVERKLSTSKKEKFLVATYSSCHGIAALIEAWVGN